MVAPVPCGGTVNAALDVRNRRDSQAQFSEMRRTALVTSSGVILSFLLACGGHWLTYSLVSGTYEIYKDDYMLISLIQTFLVLPLTSALVGTLVGTLLLHIQWLYGGVCLAPLTLYLLYESRAEGAVFMLCVIYLSVSTLSAFLVSGWRNRKTIGQRQHV